MKRIVLKLLTSALICTTFFLTQSTEVFSATPRTWSADTRAFGDPSLIAELDADGTLTITNRGTTPARLFDVTYSGDLPWIGVGLDIKKIVIGDNITHIGDHNFDGVYQYEEAYIGKDVESIGKQAFHNNDKTVKKITFAEGSKLKSIGDYAFWNLDELEEIKLPDSVTTIGDSAFDNCSKLVVNFPKNLEEIGDCAFSKCQLKDVVFPESIKKIGGNVFDDCPIASVTFTKAVADPASNISDMAFGSISGNPTLKLPSDWDKNDAPEAGEIIKWHGGFFAGAAEPTPTPTPTPRPTPTRTLTPMPSPTLSPISKNIRLSDDVVDRDTFKSELPANSVLVQNSVDAKDMLWI